jgi:hypothetical protein
MAHNTITNCVGHTNLLEFQGCIGLIDGTLIKIRKPWNDGAHKV